MDVLDKILADWQACGPAGVALPAARLHLAEERAAACTLCEPVPAAALEDARALLAPGGGAGGSSAFVRLLCGGRGGSLEGEVVHFVRFWQALHEVWRRLRQAGNTDEEPLAEEVSTFRDVFLRRFDHGGASWEWLCELAAASRNMSADDTAWAPLQAAMRQVADDVRCKPGPEAALQLDEVSALLIPWLQELVEDYCRGSRSAKIYCVLDVAGCQRQEACRHLGRSGWDVELALQSFYAVAASHQGSPSTGSAWSSGGAKLRKGEVDCPICMVPYAEGFRSVMTHCCFQVLCLACHRRLTDSNRRLSCPFCRGVSHVPEGLMVASGEASPGITPRPPAAAAGGQRPPPVAAPPAHGPARRRTAPEGAAPTPTLPRAACGGGTSRTRAAGGPVGTAGQQYRWEERARALLPACLLCSFYMVLSLCGFTGHA